MGYLNELARRIHGISTSKGFEPPSAFNIDQKLLLVVSEVCEAQEALRDGHELDEIWYEIPKGEGPDGMESKPEGFPVECADAVIRLLHIMHAVGIDIEAVIEEKVLFNANRPHKHGRTF